MITGDKYINLALKRFVSHNRMKDNFLDYLLDGQREHVSRIFPTQGLFTYPATLTYPGTSGAGYMDFSPDPIIGSDGAGHILKAAGASVLIDVPFTNTAAKDYWFALHYVEKPDGIYLNPRTGLPEYDTWEEQIGRSAVPTSVTDLGGGNARFNINSICASGVDYSGMTVTVWLNNPQDSDETIAIETLTVTYSAPNNLITMTSGTGLGQASISTTASDYTVCLNGIVWQEVATGAGNPFGSDYTILGYRDVTGAATYDSAVQNDISGGGGHSLQNAYDYTGSGAGRTIQANDQAVEITQENTAFFEDDIIQAGLRITKDGNSAAYSNTDKEYEVGLDVVGRVGMTGGVLCRVRLFDETGGGSLQKDEAITFSAAGNQITGTRPPNFTLPGNVGSILNDIDLLEISGSTSDDGVYLVDNVDSATQITVKNLDGTAVSFNGAHGGSAVVNIYRATSSLSGNLENMVSGLKIVTISDFYEDSLFVPQDGGGLDITVSSATDVASKIIHLKNESGTDKFTVQADGDVISAKNITAGTGLIATTGGVTATAGDVVCTAGDIEVTNASKNFVYGSARSFTRHYNASHMQMDETWTGIVMSDGATVPSYLVIGSDPGSVPFAELPIDLPQGAIITGIDALVDAVALTDTVGIELIRSTSDWTTPTNTVGVPAGYAATYSTTAALEVISLPAAAQTVTIDNDTYSYSLLFTCGGSTDPTGAKVYQVRVQYTAINVIP